MKTFMGIQRTLLFGLLALTLPFVLVACGGGGGTSSSTIPGGTGLATIRGQVPGSVFMAVDHDTNLEAGRATATGTPKTFSLNLPTGKTYRFYVMENEGTSNSRVYPMYIGASNVFEMDGNANDQVISLGMVSPDLMTGNATPANPSALMMGRGASAMVPAALSGTAFSMDKLKGTAWGYNTMMTSGTIGWEHGILSFDNNGMGHMGGIVRNGSPISPRDDIPFILSMSGMLTDPGDNTFQCVVSKDMSVMVATFTDNTGGPAMMIAQKRGGIFRTDGSEMTGTWRFQRLRAGSDNNTSGWAYGTMQFDFGTAGITSMTTSNGSGGSGSFAFSMDASGIMARDGDPSFYGVMSADKTMIVATDTNGGNPELWVMMKDDPAATYTTSDMMGDWVTHAISPGNPGSRGWMYGQSLVDASGNDTLFGMMGSSGPISSTRMTAVMSGGVMTMSGSGGGMGGGMNGGMMGGGLMTETFHGIMNGGKNITVSSYSDGSGGYPFSVQVK